MEMRNEKNNRNAELACPPNFVGEGKRDSASHETLTFVKIASRILALPFLALVLFYQKTLSPDHGMLKPWYPYGYCKFYPSCSEFTAIVLRKDGILGIHKIIKRVIKCRPGMAPAIDKP